jgi:hypothetical protein
MISGAPVVVLTAEGNVAVSVEQDAVLGVPGDRAGVRAVLYRRALAVSLQPLRHTGARDEATRLIRRNILQQVLVEALG